MDTWDVSGGQTVGLSDLEDWIASMSEIEGLTLSGGEPMLQAEALAELVISVRRVRDLGLVCYTGYTHEWLELHGSPQQRRLLGLIDLLVDGRYVREQHARLLWRGSSNQRLLFLSDRYSAWRDAPDQPAGLQVVADSEGAVRVVGVPGEQDFVGQLEQGLAALGLAPDRLRRYDHLEELTNA